MRKVLVTGSSGFVGRNVCKALIEKGYDVYGLSRTSPNLPGMTHIGGDIRNEGSFPSDHSYDVVHTAALASDGKEGDYHGVNVQGTANALKAYPDSKFVHISSSSIYNMSKHSDFIKEDEFSSTKYRFYNHYSKTKASAEETVLTSHSFRANPAVSLRPHAIYGEDDTTLLPKLMSRIRKNTLVLPDGGDALHSLTHIKNLVSAVCLALDSSFEEIESFNIADAHPTSIAAAVKSAAPELTRISSIPTTLALAYAKTLRSVSEYEIRQVGMYRTYSIEKAKSLLGYKPSGFVRFGK